MRNLTCIVCPIGCTLNVSFQSTPEADSPIENLSVTGNRCQRGEIYAQEEICAPKRTVTATCSAVYSTCQTEGKAFSVRRLPVKTSSPCSKEKISALLEDIYNIKVTLPVKAGDKIITNWKGEGIHVVATRTLGFQEIKDV
ncbi:MAG: DUF1667 domain-containing protein [Treponema sp.]|jgi:CxxC motif-containing protein|nr:DUF1667 domain-containing protein [Treponema sp.]